MIYCIAAAAVAAVSLIAARLWIPPTLPDGGFQELASVTAAPPAALPPNTPNVPDSRRPGVAVALETWSAPGLDSATAHLARIGTLLPFWYHLDASGGIELESIARADLLKARVAESGASASIIPVVGDDGSPGRLTQLLAAPEKRRTLVRRLDEIVASTGIAGICIDLSGLPAASADDAFLLLAEMRLVFGAGGAAVCIVLSAGGDLASIERLSTLSDRVVLLGLEEPVPGSAPAPLAPQAWFEQTMGDALQRIDPAKVTAALGTGGYVWTEGDPNPRRIGYPAAMHLASSHGAEIKLDPVSLNTTFSFTGDDGRTQTVWLLDAVSFHNQLTALKKVDASSVAVWPAGGEDPGVWTLLDDERAPPAASLAAVSLAGTVLHEGTGPAVRIVATPQPGLRVLGTNRSSGLIVEQRYAALPQGYLLRRWGGEHAKDIVLTFDDGPDPDYTPRILDILQEASVPAAFFVTGERAFDRPDLLRRMVDEGHEIGNHTYSHINITDVPTPTLRVEVNSTQRLIIAATGRKTLLFRPPYNAGTLPDIGSEASPLTTISELGYLSIDTEIDPADWRQPNADAIVSSVLEEAGAGGAVIVLHDAGGDRSRTVEVLPRLIETLRAEGYRFISMAELLGTARDALMPGDEGYNLVVDATLIDLVRLLRTIVLVVFGAAVVLGITRAAAMVALAVLRKRHPVPTGGYQPAVTVLVPAYCEEGVIVESVESLLACSYPDLNVLVIDDGSTDRTYQVVQRVYANHPRVRVVSQGNRGKAEALNHGYRLATTEIIVAVDADTRLAPDAIGLMVRHFADPRVGAVAGNVKVVNRDNLLARMQALEYITGQNLERRALETVGAITVIPGAIGAWRKKAVLAAGGLSSDTLAEDADLTFAVQETGYRVVYEEDAIALTQAPQTVRQFMRQRFRWIFGMLQTAWKHRSALREGRPIGIFGVANILLFGTLLPLLAPIVDVMLVVSIAGFLSQQVTHPMDEISYGWLYGTAFSLAFILADLLLVWIAFLYEPREKKSLLLRAPLQRVFYRQLLYLIVFRALYFALSGQLAGWRKISRIPTAVSDTVLRADARVTELEWEEPNRRRWNRRAIDLNWQGPEQRAGSVADRRDRSRR